MNIDARDKGWYLAGRCAKRLQPPCRGDEENRLAIDVEGERVAEIGPGMLVLLGVGREDGEAEADRLADKVRALRIFDDAEGRMNASRPGR